jgi:dTDP-glucose pyrophosphorylase
MHRSETRWRQAILLSNATIGQAIRNLEQTALKIVMVANATGVLEGTISDGDIRRALLKGLDLNSPIASVTYRNALVVPPDLGRELVMRLMVANKVQQIPVVDDQHSVVGLHLWDEISEPLVRPNMMLIMAGGVGARLRPHTETVPKPMLPVAGKPMLEHIIEHAKNEGFSRFTISLNYLGHMIEDHFGDGEGMEVQIDYLKETTPLGTAGALGLLKQRPELPFVVTNGDVLSDIKYGELLDFHMRHYAMATMAVRSFEWQHPFGVVKTQGLDIVGLEEKPISRTHINAGIYVLSPDALQVITPNRACDMPSLFEQLQSGGKRILAYPMHEPWLDVGRPDDLQRARHVHQENER